MRRRKAHAAALQQLTARAAEVMSPDGTTARRPRLRQMMQGDRALYQPGGAHMRPAGPNLNLSHADRALVMAIATRAGADQELVDAIAGAISDATGRTYTPEAAQQVTRNHVALDVTATHRNGTPLDLPALLAAEPDVFRSDLLGIARFLDRTTGKIRPASGWTPTAALPEVRLAAKR